MIILTQNVKKWTGKQQQGLAKAIISLQPDIAVCTEHRQRKEADKAKAFFEQTGYAHHYESLSPDNAKLGGLLVVSKQPLTLAKPIEWHAQESWRLMTFDVGPFTLSAAYWPQKDAKEDCWKHWLRVCSNISKPHLSLGDFNTGRNDLDKAPKGAKFFCADYFDRLEEGSMIDLWRERNPETREYSWYSTAGNGFRIDHAFGNSSMHKMIQRCWYDHAIREDELGDHSTLLVEVTT